MQPMIELKFGDVRAKLIQTPNHFVSHMLEHIAWRMGLSAQIAWHNDDWKSLGRTVGERLAQFPRYRESASALGMIDDGSAAISVQFGKPRVELNTCGGVSKAWLLQLRCEQVNDATPLLDLLEGLSVGLNAEISVTVWTLEDPHHTWEGVFRGIGITLGKICCPREPEFVQALEDALANDREVFANSNPGEIRVLEKGAHRARVERGTAETGIIVDVEFGNQLPNVFEMEIDQSIVPVVSEAEKLFEVLSRQLGARLEIKFRATVLSSSHVFMEDIGLVLGRALLEILKIRMERHGIQGAGSNLATLTDIQEQNVRVGVSVEGRKFWRLVPENGDHSSLRQNFIIGQNVLATLRSEDLDDFLDGLSGGMSASIMCHICDYRNPSKTWLQLFESLGIALRECFQLNPYRKGVPPGVKATLA